MHNERGTVARIDKFIEAALGHSAEELILAPGEKIQLVRGGVPRPLSAKELEAAQILSVLTEIAPAVQVRALEAGEACEFAYLAPAGPVRIQVEEGGTARVVPSELGLVGAPKAGTPAENGDGPGSSSNTESGDPQSGVPKAGTSGGQQALPRAQKPDGPASGSPVRAEAVSLGFPGPGGPNASGGSPELETLLCKMVENGCSDLHLCAGYPPLYRKDGDIADLGGGPDLDSARVTRLLREVTTDETWEHFVEHNDVDFSYEILGIARFRCNLFVDRQGMGGVFRTIPSVIPSAEQLGLARSVLNLCDLHKGLVVVTGPTGSGKSTTLAAMIDHINKTQARHIITIEDPIEFVHPKRRALVNQREIGTHTAGFRSALRAALREDPDIVLLGEMRDLETVEIALETAETGHLVFGTLHTNTAASTVDRIIDQFPPDQQAQIRVLLSETLKGVIAQTLCKKAGGGRVAAQELLFVTPAISNLIREGKTFQIPSLMQTGKGQGMQTLDSRLLELVQEKTVSVEEAYSKSITRIEFKSLLERNGLSLPKAA